MLRHQLVSRLHDKHYFMPCAVSAEHLYQCAPYARPRLAGRLHLRSVHSAGGMDMVLGAPTLAQRDAGQPVWGCADHRFEHPNRCGEELIAELK